MLNYKIWMKNNYFLNELDDPEICKIVKYKNTKIIIISGSKNKMK